MEGAGAAVGTLLATWMVVKVVAVTPAEAVRAVVERVVVAEKARAARARRPAAVVTGRTTAHTTRSSTQSKAHRPGWAREQSNLSPILPRGISLSAEVELVRLVESGGV